MKLRARTTPFSDLNGVVFLLTKRHGRYLRPYSGILPGAHVPFENFNLDEPLFLAAFLGQSCMASTGTACQERDLPVVREVRSDLWTEHAVDRISSARASQLASLGGAPFVVVSKHRRGAG